jgi:hypothetical protein
MEFTFFLLKLESKEHAGHATKVMEKRHSCCVLVEKPEEKIALGVSSPRYVDNIKMDLRNCVMN